LDQEKLIKKWINNDLNQSEMEDFNTCDDVSFLKKISEHVKYLKAPEYDSDLGLVDFKTNYATSKADSSQNWFVYFGRIAASVVVFLGLFFGLSFYETDIRTRIAETQTQTLPDNSIITLNAVSTASYNPLFWFKNRTITLDGEAYFKVKKGSSFRVETKLGTVTVTGTKFKVKQRAKFLEVVCYEGSVSVETSTEQHTVNAGNQFYVLNNKSKLGQTQLIKPTWVDHYSQFEYTPISLVLSEFERQYNIKLKLINIDTNALFTGRFPHKNLEKAIQSIAIPMNYKIKLKPKIITIQNE
jgi:ferric-dicitrate binding protein FerR (iron transport regulator)